MSKIKTLSHETTNTSSKYTDVRFIEHNSRIIKFYHEIYNSGEYCYTQIFDGNSFNTIVSLYDLGHTPSQDATYVSDLSKKQSRTNSLFTKSINLINLIIK